MIEDTSKRDPVLHMAGVLGGMDRYIPEMEAAGQAQLVESTKLPTEVNGGAESDLTAVGVQLGPVDEQDPMFRDVTLPVGWVKQGSDHDMWSYVKDELGRIRLRVFYKAAFYDRSAFVAVATPYSYAHSIADGDSRMVLDESWATRESMTAAFERIRGQAEEGLPYQRDGDTFYTDQIARCDELIAELGGGS